MRLTCASTSGVASDRQVANDETKTKENDGISSETNGNGGK